MGRPRVSPSAKERIRDSAIHLFSQKGYSGTTTRAICDRAAVTAPVLYHHFGNKEKLYHEVILDTLNDYRKATIQASQEQGSVRERLIRVLEAEFALTRKRPEFFRLMTRLLFAREPEQPAFNHATDSEEQLDFLSRILAEGVQSGEIQGEPRRIASLLIGMKAFYTFLHAVPGKAKLDREDVELIVGCLLDGFGAGRGTKTRCKQ